MGTPEQSARHHSWADKLASPFVQITLVLFSIVGLPSSSFWVLNLFLSDRASKIGALLVTLVGVIILLALFIRSWKSYLWWLTIFLLCANSLVSGGLVYWSLFVKGDVQSSERADEWDVWARTIKNGVDGCQNTFLTEEPKIKDANYNEKLSPHYRKKAACIAKVLQEAKYPHQGEASKFKVAALANDVRAGSYLLQNEVVLEVLRTQLGLEEKFLGTGLAIPSGGEKGYADARLPEYLVPNLPEDKAEILRWTIAPKSEAEISSQPVKCLITRAAGCRGRILPNNIRLSVREEKDKYERMIKQIDDPEKRDADDKIIFIRFNRFDANNYRGTLGRPPANWAFMLRLSDVWEMPLNEALIYSGHQIQDSQSSNSLFVWVYISESSPDLRFQATWINILGKIDKLLK